MLIVAVLCVTLVVDDFPLPAIAVIGAMAGVSAVATGIRLVRWANTYYLVTDRRIVYWKGVPRWRGIELSLDLVDEINANQEMWQRLLGVGTLRVRSVVEGHVRRLSFVPRPAEVCREVYRLPSAKPISRPSRTPSRRRPKRCPAMTPTGPPSTSPTRSASCGSSWSWGSCRRPSSRRKKQDLLRRV